MEAIETMASASATVRRRRTGKKRLSFRVPQLMPPGVRELWQRAPMEEQMQAHRSCVQILSMWLGKARREEVAQTLEIPPLRVWQLSQQALAGMLAGLLKQPRSRRLKKEGAPMHDDDDPRVLRKKNAELERKLAERNELIQLLIHLPKPGDPPSPTTPSSASPAAAKTRTKSKKGRPGAREREGQGGSASGDTAADAR